MPGRPPVRAASAKEEEPLDRSYRLRILRPFLGARILKTALAVFIALAAFHRLGSGYATFAAVAAVLAVQPSVHRALTVFTQQMVGNLVGGTVAAILGLWLGSSPLTMALGVMIALGICSRFGLTEAANLAVIAVLYIMDRPDQDFLLYTGARMAVVAAGMSIGYLINRFVRPPDFTAQTGAEIAAASQGVASFCDRLLDSLAKPDQFTREQVKTEAGEIRRHLEAAARYLELNQESRPEDPHSLRLDRTRSALNTCIERFSDIHRVVLQIGGLNDAETPVVAAALKAACQYAGVVAGAALGDAGPDEQRAEVARQTQAALAGLVDEMVDRQQDRQRGLLLHSILDDLRYVSWRLDAVATLLRSGTEADL